MTVSPTSVPPAPRGPAWRSTPVAAYSLGDQYAELAASCGLLLDDWQAAALVDGLGVNLVDGLPRWASFEVGLCCPRQNGKSAVLEALMLGSLFLDGGLTIYSAHEFKTAQELYRRVDALIRANGELDALVKRRVTSTNEMGLELFDGSRLRFLARSGGAGRGFSADRLVFDESMILSAASMGAILPTLSARPNPQVWYAGSAGKRDSDHWRAVRDRGRAGTSTRLTWIEYGNERGVDPTDRGAWFRANPELGRRLRVDVIEAEYEALGQADETLAEWLRERLGVWDDPAAVDQVFDPGVWAALEDADSKALDPVALAIDVEPGRRYAAIAAAGKRADGRRHVEVVWHGELGPRFASGLAAICKRQDIVEVTVDAGSAAMSLVPALEGAGLQVNVTTARDYAAACGVLELAVLQDRLRHLGQPELAEALAGAGRRPLGEAWAWSARSSAVDISRLVAATLALWAHERSLDAVNNVW